MDDYQPIPIDVSDIDLPPELAELADVLARNVHDTWADRRIQEGWQFGPHRDDDKKEHPGLVPYEQLSDSEKAYDVTTAMGTLKVILALGYKVSREQ